MRIQDKPGSPEVGTPRTAPPPQTGTIGGAFIDALQQSAMNLQIGRERQDLLRLRKLLDEAAGSLDLDPSLENLEYFRSVLGVFLRKAMSQAYQVLLVGQGWGEGDVHHVVATINHEVEELVLLVIAEHQDRMKITGKIIRIKGLVIDLML